MAPANYKPILTRTLQLARIHHAIHCWMLPRGPVSRMTLVFSGVLFASATQVVAAEVKIDQQTCYAGPAHLIQHADGMLFGSYAVIGTTPGTEGTPFRMLSGQCLGAFSDIRGKFADMSGGGKWMPIGNFPPSGMPNMFNGCNHESGST